MDLGVHCIELAEFILDEEIVEVKPKKYKGKNGNLYLKQIQAFSKLIENGKLNYKTTNKALHIQEVVDKIYNNK